MFSDKFCDSFDLRPNPQLMSEEMKGRSLSVKVPHKPSTPSKDANTCAPTHDEEPHSLPHSMTTPLTPTHPHTTSTHTNRQQHVQHNSCAKLMAHTKTTPRQHTSHHKPHTHHSTQLTPTYNTPYLSHHTPFTTKPHHAPHTTHHASTPRTTVYIKARF